ncbi:hypothetical protein [Pseudidiomarina sediminum]|nr:hypothetical protein [Pseudidiomarina sediminum]
MKNYLVYLGALLLVGCASTGEKIVIDRNSQYLTSNQQQNNPAISKVSSISPGDPVLESFDVTVRPAIELKEAVKFDGTYNGFVNSYEISPSVLPLVGQNRTGRFFGADNKVRQKVSASNTDIFVDGGIFVPNNPDMQHGLFIDNYSTALELLPFVPTYSFTDIETTERGDFRQEFIFTGRAGTLVNFEYREYIGGLARPAFTQSVSFDIKDDKLIGFKGAMFEVIDVSNASLTYKVMKHFRQN